MSSQLDVLDPHVSLKWEECSSLPETMMDAQAMWLNDRYSVSLDNKVYVRNAAEVYIYNSQSDTWEEDPLATPVKNFAITTYRSELVLVGGREANGVLSGKVFARRNDEWVEEYSPIPIKRRSASVISDGDHLVVAGGCGEHGPLSRVDVYDGESWRQAEPLPEPCFLMKSILHDGKWYLMGGPRQERRAYCASLQTLVSSSKVAMTTTTTSWSKLPDVPCKHSSPAACGNRLIVTGPNSSAIYAYTDEANTNPWRCVGEIPKSTHCQNCTISLPNGELLVMVKEIGSVEAHCRTFIGYIVSAENGLEVYIERLKQRNFALLEENKKLKITIKKLKEPSQLKQEILDMKDHYYVTFYLDTMQDSQIRRLGQALGLSYQNVQKMKEDVVGEMVAAWLREEDDVLDKSGHPTWENLAKALREVGQKGIAEKVESSESTDGDDLEET